MEKNFNLVKKARDFILRENCPEKNIKQEDLEIIGKILSIKNNENIEYIKTSGKLFEVLFNHLPKEEWRYSSEFEIKPKKEMGWNKMNEILLKDNLKWSLTDKRYDKMFFRFDAKNKYYFLRINNPQI